MLKIEKELNEKGKEEILELKAQGFSNQDIADKINSKYFFDFSSTDVLNYIQKRENSAIKIMQKRGDFEEKMAEQYFSTIEQLKELNRQMWEEFYNLRQNPEYREKVIKCSSCGSSIKVKLKSATETIKAADHLLKEIQHVDQILGKIANKSLNINYNIVELTERIQKVMPEIAEDWEKHGIIKIKNKKKIRVS